MKFLGDIPRTKTQTALVRIDLNISDEDMHTSLRVDRSIVTIQALRQKGYRIVLLSHRGRPSGPERNLSLKPFASLLSKRLGEKVFFQDAIGVHASPVCLLENLRFYPGEDANSEAFARKLALLGDIYVNDAFSFSHRDTASMVGITRFLPSYGGLSFEKELKTLLKARGVAKRPYTLVLGGAKVSDKLPLLHAFEKKADHILVGGGIANTIFYTQDIPVGDSLYDPHASIRPSVLRKVLVPLDVRVHNGRILDIGPATCKLYEDVIKASRYVVWGGSVGDTDREAFSGGSVAVLAALCASKADVLIGGGETSSFVLKHKTMPHLTSSLASGRIFLSSAGGAMLEFLSGKKLPGVEALK